MINFASVRAFFFDVDETVFSVTPSVAHHYREVLLQFNIESDERSLNDALSSVWGELKPYYENSAGNYQTFPVRERELWREFARRVVSSIGIEPHNTIVDALYDRFSQGNTRILRPGFRELLTFLTTRNYTTGLFTNNDSRFKGVCEFYKLQSLLSYQFSACVLGYKKPSPLAFKAIEGKTGILGTENLYVGNSIEHDYDGALAAGWQALLYAPTEHARMKAEERNIPYIQDFTELIRQF